MSEPIIPEHKLVQEAKSYAVNIINEANTIKEFAVNMIDYAGMKICPYIVELYKEMSPILITQGISQDNIEEIENIDIEEIKHWFYEYKSKQETPEQRQERFKENIDELQFLVSEYRKTEEFQKMLNFVGKFNYIAPYNSMLVQMQKPGSQLVLEGKRWFNEYNRLPKPNAQKLIILKQFGPVQCIFDISDTEPIDKEHMTEDEYILEQWENRLNRIEGNIDYRVLKQLKDNLPSYGVYLDVSFNATTTLGGYVKPYSHDIIVRVKKDHNLHCNSRFLISVNRRQNETEKFHTICHELAHIFCRHYSYDPEKRRNLSLKEREFEAETVAWLVCKRQGIMNPSEEYLAVYAPDGEIPFCSTDGIMKAVAEIEKMLQKDLNAKQTLWYKEDESYKRRIDDFVKALKKEKEAKKK